MRRGWLGFGLCAAAGFGLLSSIARADTAQLTRQLEQVNDVLISAERQYSTEALRADARERDWQRIVQEAEVLFLVKDYRQTALLLLPVLADVPAPMQKSSLYGRALLYLAESLYALKQPEIALFYYRDALRVLGDLGNTALGPNSEQVDNLALAIERVISLCTDGVCTEETITGAYRDYQKGVKSVASDSVRYLYARYLLVKDGDAESALRELEAIPDDAPESVKARYAQGGALVALGRIDESLRIFSRMEGARRRLLGLPAQKFASTEAVDMNAEEKIAASAANSADATDVFEEASIARGRLLYELGRFDEAIDSYQNIPFDSPRLNMTLREVVAVYVQRAQAIIDGAYGVYKDDQERQRAAAAEYEKALDRLDDLRALENDPTKSSDLELLMGNLLLQQRSYDAAAQTFFDVRARYEPIANSLRKLLGTQNVGASGTITQIRSDLLRSVVEVQTNQLMSNPPLEKDLVYAAAQNDEIREALKVFRDFEDMQSELKSLRTLIDRLDKNFNTSSLSRYELFPSLRAAVSQYLLIHNRLAKLDEQLLQEQEKYMDRLDPQVAARIKELRDQRKNLTSALASLPTEIENLQARRKKYDDMIQERDFELQRSSIEINQLKQQVVYLDLISAQEAKDTPEHPLKRQNLRSKVLEMRQILETLSTQQQQTQRNLDEIRRSLSMAGLLGDSDPEVRTRYLALAAEERALLRDGMQGRADGTWQSLLSLERQFSEANQNNEAFLRRIEGEGDLRLSRLRAIIDAEKQTLQRSETASLAVGQQLAQLQPTVADLVVAIIERTVDENLTRADLGGIDVAFAQKQAETEQIGRLVREQGRALQSLRQAYSDLQRDEVVDAAKPAAAPAAPTGENK